MPRTLVIFLITAFAGVLGACSQSAPERAEVPPLYVPTVMIAQAPNAEPAANPYDVLPSSDAVTLWVPRFEKFAWGPIVYGESSAYSIFTYDQQRISSLPVSSYRYRWVVQQGVTSP